MGKGWNKSLQNSNKNIYLDVMRLLNREASLWNRGLFWTKQFIQFTFSILFLFWLCKIHIFVFIKRCSWFLNRLKSAKRRGKKKTALSKQDLSFLKAVRITRITYVRCNVTVFKTYCFQSVLGYPALYSYYSK